MPDFLLDLYRETGKARYLAKAVRSAEYCLSFMFAYNVHFPPETECGRRGMSSYRDLIGTALPKKVDRPSAKGVEYRP